MPSPVWYSYAVIRVVPRVERGEFLNVGVVLFARTARCLIMSRTKDDPRLGLFAPDLDLDAVARHLRAFALICDGADGPIARLSQSERFAWLTSPRSTVIQTSPVHVGWTEDPLATLDELYDALVRVPGVVRVGE